MQEFSTIFSVKICICIVVYSIISERSFDEVQHCVKRLRELYPGAVLAIAGNMCDREDIREVGGGG